MTRSVAILTPSFYDLDGEHVWAGGGERYLVELYRQLKDLGAHAEVFQPARRDWHREYRGIPVSGLSPVVVQDDMWPATNRRFQEVARHFDRHLFFSFQMAWPEARPGSLALVHSVWWDDPLARPRRPAIRATRIADVMGLANRIISNDTNVMNWVRATHPHLESRFGFIPNFVDLSRFAAVPKPPGPFTVLFPRRLTPQKGLAETVEAALRLTAQYRDIQVHLVGRGAPAEEAAMADLAARNSHIRWGWQDPDDMAPVYQAADVVLIPSLGAEGTSLSCLEAMACGRPVIAGQVGGLCNLIIDEYNGLLVRVTPETLVRAVLRLRSDPALRERLARRGREVAAVHSLDHWRKRWQMELARFLGS